MLYNRSYLRSNNLALGGFGGQRTEVRVYPAGICPRSPPDNSVRPHLGRKEK